MELEQVSKLLINLSVSHNDVNPLQFVLAVTQAPPNLPVKVSSTAKFGLNRSIGILCESLNSKNGSYRDIMPKKGA